MFDSWQASTSTPICIVVQAHKLIQARCMHKGKQGLGMCICMRGWGGGGQGRGPGAAMAWRTRPAASCWSWLLAKGVRYERQAATVREVERHPRAAPSTSSFPTPASTGS